MPGGFWHTGIDLAEGDCKKEKKICPHHNLFCPPHYISTNLADYPVI